MTTLRKKRVRLTEFWTPVAGFEGAYEVSCFGRVRSLKGEKVKLLTPICSGRYYFVNLYLNGKNTPRKVHHLVLEAFVGPCPEGYECNHDDGDTSNNVLWNLEWSTKSANQLHKCHTLGLTVKEYSFAKDGKIVSLRGIRKFCREHNLNPSNMIKVHNGERTSHKGWRIAA